MLKHYSLGITSNPEPLTKELLTENMTYTIQQKTFSVHSGSRNQLTTVQVTDSNDLVAVMI